MSYLAIARKWRPQRFEEIAGQTHITRTLQNAIRLKRIHHAFLFCGARGVGKTSAARILAKALNCEHGPAENPCNECVACKEITRGGHPDVSEIDGASNNRVDDVRDLIETVRYMPSKGRYRIYIIDEVHMVTTAAFNALLKTLEEPPEHVVFIFATTDVQRLPDTVISRCQRFDFKMLPARTIQERLGQICEAEEVTIPEVTLSQIAREAAGSMRDGQSLLDQVLSFADGAITESQAAEILGLVDRALLHELVGAMVACDPGRTLDAYTRIVSFGVDIRSLASEILSLLRHATVTSIIDDPSRLIDLPAEEVASLKRLASSTGPDGLLRRFEILSRAIDDIVRSDVPELVLEMTLVRMARIQPYAPVESLVKRLVDMERRLASGTGGPRPAPPRSRPAPRERETTPPPVARAPAPPKSPEPPQQPPQPRPAKPPQPRPAKPPQPRPAKPPVDEPPPQPSRPAPAAQPSSDGGSGPRDAAEWASFVASIGGAMGAIKAVIAEGRFVEVQGSEIVLGFAEPATRQMASTRLGSSELLEALRRHFGRDLSVQAVALDDPATTTLSPGEQARHDASERRQQREQRARKHPAIEIVQSAFPGSTISKIRHLKS